MTTAFLTDDAIRATCPSAFATKAHSKTSERYSFIPTSRVIEAMRDSGFYPVSAQQSNARTAGSIDTTRHVLRFQSKDDALRVELAKEKANAEAKKSGKHAWIDKANQPLYPQLVFSGSHDGSAPYVLETGLYRLVCGNGLVVCAQQFTSLKVKHSNVAVEEVLTASYRIMQELPQLAEQIHLFQSTQLTPHRAQVFAYAALACHYGEDDKGNLLGGITTEAVLAARREEDAANDLWSIYNRVQENMVKGGILALSAANRQRHTRAITSVDSGLDLNRQLWCLAEEMATVN